MLPRVLLEFSSVMFHPSNVRRKSSDTIRADDTLG